MESNPMHRFCRDQFWDDNLTWNTSNPEFTECFKETVLVCVPCAFLWIFCPFEIYYMYNSTKKKWSCTWLFISKLSLTILLTLHSIVDLGMAIYTSYHETVYDVKYYAPSVKIFTFILATILLAYNRKYGLRRSGVLFLFYLLLVLCGGVQFGSSIIEITGRMEPNYFVISYLVYYSFLSITFLSHFFADVKLQTFEHSKTDRVCPQEYSSFPSDIFFAWFDSLVWRGFREPLEQRHLWSVSHENTTSEITTTVEKYWKETLLRCNSHNILMESFEGVSGKRKGKCARKQATASILPALWKTFGSTIIFGGFIKLIEGSVILVGPQLLRCFLACISDNDHLWKGYLYVILIVVTRIVGTLIGAQHDNRMSSVGLRIRTAVIALIYRKTLILPNTACMETTTGEIVNLMSVDAQTLMRLTKDIHIFWAAPFQIIVTFYILWDLLGPSVLAGLVVLIVVLPVYVFVIRTMLELRSRQMVKKDTRLKLIHEVLSGIKVMKLYAWENCFERNVTKIRNEEMELVRKYTFCSAFVDFVLICLPSLLCSAALVTYVLVDDNHVLDAEKVFVSIALFNVVQLPVIVFSDSFVHGIQAFVALRRINKFMNAEELDPSNVYHDQPETHPLIIVNGKFKWTADKSEKPTLRNINLYVRRGQLVALVGPVGSGKSSLLSAFLGEMNRLSGRVNTKGTIAYVSQRAWIQNATVRNNILFGSAYDEKLYNQVINACALRPDLDILPAGDRTEIGENGINLSGGQKQRISIARAVYNGASIYFFDDSMSSLDAHVGKHIFENVIGPNGMLRNKTRVLITHGISYLPQVDDILVMNGGEITERGTYIELLDKKGTFSEFILQHLHELDRDSVFAVEKIQRSSVPAITVGEWEHDSSEYASSSFEIDYHFKKLDEHELTDVPLNEPETTVTRRSGNRFDDEDGLPEASQCKAGERCVEVEKTEIGNIKWKVYLHYLKALGYFISAMVLVTIFTSDMFAMSANIWLSFWTNDNTTVIDGIEDHLKRDKYLGIYVAFNVAKVALLISSLVLAAIAGVRGSILLHEKLLFSILRAPVGFFDVTPSGRLLNRFGKDIDILDTMLPEYLKYFAFAVAMTFFVISPICWTSPIITALIIPIAVFYYFLQRYYIATTRQLNRLESVSRSPIYCHFSETITGAESIRAYGVQEKFIRELEKRVDRNQKCWIPNIIADQWLAVRLEMAGNAIVFFVGLFGILHRDSHNASFVGLAMSYALQVTAFLNWMVKVSSEVESNIVAVERLKEYSEITGEAPWEVAEDAPNEEWPKEGRIEFRNYQVRYRKELDVVLRGVTFTVRGGEKVGIVGRTGAGKSSIAMALFRIIEAAGGQIIIDNVDISKIGLHTLRSKLAIIPQDPVVFAGTLRQNLDPFDFYTDDEIWAALEYAHLKCMVTGFEDGLMHEITEGGANFSVGQRQLICLARALLRKNKILVLDEATASVDMECDRFIQRTIREEFRDCTVLTIAHRLNTILDSDRVIVLDKGIVAEHGPPEVLLERKTSLFYAIAKDAGLVL